MANIIVSFGCWHLDPENPDKWNSIPYYEGLIKALIGAGHNVQSHNVAYYSDIQDNRMSTNKTDINIDDLEYRIKKFNPDLIIAFNHTMYRRIYDITECPVAVLSADSFSNYRDVDLISDNLERVSFFDVAIENSNRIQQYFNIPKSKFYHQKLATSFVSEKKDKDINISFIGAAFNFTTNAQTTLGKEFGNYDKMQTIRKFLEAKKETPFVNNDEIAKKLNISQSCIRNAFPEENDVISIISATKRQRVLSNVSELGLRWFGLCWQPESLIERNLPLAMSFDNSPTWSVQQNQDVYNRSKLCINVIQSHSGNAYPWRVLDIMATSGCLVSEYRESIKDHFGKWVKIPMFNDEYEVRSLCRKLLDDQQWRAEIVAGCNIAVKEGGFLFSDRVREIEEVFGLQKDKNSDGDIEVFIPVKHNNLDSSVVSAPIVPENVEVQCKWTVKSLVKRSLNLILKYMPRGGKKLLSRLCLHISNQL